MAKILSPNKQYTGISASVHFCNGEGKTEEEHLIEWFKQHEYEVVEEEIEEEKKKRPSRKKE